jgi:hypothetical protein
MNNNAHTIPGCRVCGSHHVAYLCHTHNEHSQTTIIHNFRCKACGSVYVGNEIDGSELAVAYSTLNATKYYEEIELLDVAEHVINLLLEKQGLPGFLAPIFVPFLYPFLATNLFNPNKAIATARKAKQPADNDGE